MENNKLLERIFEDVTTIKADVKGICKIQDDQEKRIRGLEKIRWLITGGLVILYGIVIYILK